MCQQQDRLTSRLAVMLDEGLGLRDTLRLCLVAVGRGGQGDVGQRIRDEILHVQAQSNAKVRPLSSPPLASKPHVSAAHCKAPAQQKQKLQMQFRPAAGVSELSCLKS